MENTYYGIEKLAGLKSEIGGAGASAAVPILGPIGTIAGLVAAGVTPTLTKKEMKEQGKKTWSNFIPGVGTYRLYKRLGRSQVLAGEKKSS